VYGALVDSLCAAVDASLKLAFWLLEGGVVLNLFRDTPRKRQNQSIRAQRYELAPMTRAP
jgi:hypothetical protein